tara:strand:+ start:880 stop:1590 length:711 start_codon:yes stop_codon:yes gene_type:complete
MEVLNTIKMKKILLFTLLSFTMMGFGQDIPLKEKKVTTKKMKNKDKKLKEKEKKIISDIEKKRRRKYNRSLALDPENQIGYITNLKSHPWGGISYFNYFTKDVGFYIDFRPAINFLHPDNFTSTGSPDGGVRTEYGQTLWTSVINAGVSLSIYNSKSRAIMIYAGLGNASQKTYLAEYDEFDILSGDWWYYEDGGEINKTNFNIGLLLQTTSRISWQIGFDSAVEGVNFGVGYKLK